MCAGCGHPWPVHPFGCPVLVRLSAALLARAEPYRWRWWAVALSATEAAPDGRAEHWRRVSGEPDPNPDEEPGPSLHDAPGGLSERFGGSTPGGGAVLRAAAGWLDAAGAGWVTIHPAAGTLDCPDEFPPFAPPVFPFPSFTEADS